VRLRFRRHRCPADVEITFCINGQAIIGPVSGEALAYITKFGGTSDLLESYFPAGRIDSLHCYVTYLPPKRR
jgi:hypothetical protein